MNHQSEVKNKRYKKRKEGEKLRANHSLLQLDCSCTDIARMKERKGERKVVKTVVERPETGDKTGIKMWSFFSSSLGEEAHRVKPPPSLRRAQGIRENDEGKKGKRKRITKSWIDERTVYSCYTF